MKKFYRVQEAANQIGISGTTLRVYTTQGRIESNRNPAGQRIYSQAHIDVFLGRESTQNPTAVAESFIVSEVMGKENCC